MSSRYLKLDGLTPFADENNNLAAQIAEALNGDKFLIGRQMQSLSFKQMLRLQEAASSGIEHVISQVINEYGMDAGTYQRPNYSGNNSAAKKPSTTVKQKSSSTMTQKPSPTVSGNNATQKKISKTIPYKSASSKIGDAVFDDQGKQLGTVHTDPGKMTKKDQVVIKDRSGKIAVLDTQKVRVKNPQAED